VGRSPSVRHGITVVDLVVLASILAAGSVLAWKWVMLSRGEDAVLNYPTFELGTRASSIVALFLSLGLLILRWKGPRPSRRRIFRQPGFVACLVACLSTILSALSTFRLALRIGYLDHIAEFSSYFTSFLDTTWIGCDVLTVWLALALSGRWRAEPSWIDRTGRAVGLIWIGLFIAGSLHEYLTIQNET
jgi:hypothetical protein